VKLGRVNMHVGSRSAAIGLDHARSPVPSKKSVLDKRHAPEKGGRREEGRHAGAVPGFRPSPGNSEETTTRVLTEEISVLFRVPTWDPTHPGSPGSRALPGNTPTQGPTREGKPGFFLGGGGNPGRNPGHGLGKTRERGGFRVFPGWYCWGL